MFCPRCGNESPDGMTFCDKCGNPLPLVPKPQVNSGMMYETTNNTIGTQNYTGIQNDVGATSFNGTSNTMGAQSFNGTPNMMGNQNMGGNQMYQNSNPKKEKRKKEKPPKTGKKKAKIIFFFIFMLIILVGGMYLGIKVMESGAIDLVALGIVKEQNVSDYPGIANANIKNSITYKGYQLAPNFDYDITYQNDKIYLNIDGTIASIEYHPEIAYDDMFNKATSLKTDIQKTMGNNYYVGDPTTSYKNEKQYIDLMIYDINWKPFSRVFYTGERGGQGVWLVSVAPVDYDKYDDVLEMIIEAKKTTKVYSTYANELVLPNLEVLEQPDIVEVPEVQEVLSGDINENPSGDSGETFSGNQEILSE